MLWIVGLARVGGQKAVQMWAENLLRSKRLTVQCQLLRGLAQRRLVRQLCSRISVLLASWLCVPDRTLSRKRGRL